MKLDVGGLYIYKDEDTNRAVKVRLVEIAYRDVNRHIDLLGGRVFDIPFVNSPYYFFEPIDPILFKEYPDIVFREDDVYKHIIKCDTIDGVDDLYRI